VFYGSCPRWPATHFPNSVYNALGEYVTSTQALCKAGSSCDADKIFKIRNKLNLSKTIISNSLKLQSKRERNISIGGKTENLFIHLSAQEF
jgi:hypothetical protein